VDALSQALLLDDAREHRVEQPPLCPRERREQDALKIFGKPTDLVERAAPFRGHVQAVATPVVGAGAAGDETPALQRVEEGDELAGEDPEEVTERPLGESRVRANETEDPRVLGR
jgi:hypothetical protein